MPMLSVGSACQGIVGLTAARMIPSFFTSNLWCLLQVSTKNFALYPALYSSKASPQFQLRTSVEDGARLLKVAKPTHTTLRPTRVFSTIVLWLPGAAVSATILWSWIQTTRLDSASSFKYLMTFVSAMKIIGNQAFLLYRFLVWSLLLIAPVFVALCLSVRPSTLILSRRNADSFHGMPVLLLQHHVHQATVWLSYQSRIRPSPKALAILKSTFRAVLILRCLKYLCYQGASKLAKPNVRPGCGFCV